MKRNLVHASIAIVIMTLLAGCAWEVGGGSKQVTIRPTMGQELIDLQKAKDAGAITDADYQVQREKVLRGK
jgi:hypothetical protein